jgi:hypothetical protein
LGFVVIRVVVAGIKVVEVVVVVGGGGSVVEVRMGMRVKNEKECVYRCLAGS